MEAKYPYAKNSEEQAKYPQKAYFVFQSPQLGGILLTIRWFFMA